MGYIALLKKEAKIFSHPVQNYAIFLFVKLIMI